MSAYITCAAIGERTQAPKARDKSETGAGDFLPDQIGVDAVQRCCIACASLGFGRMILDDEHSAGFERFEDRAIEGLHIRRTKHRVMQVVVIL